MDLTLLNALAKYNAYANHQILEAASDLSSESLENAPFLSHTSGFKLIRHLLAVEASYLTQCRGQSLSLEWESLHTLEGLVKNCGTIGDELQVYTASFSDEDAARVIDFSLGEHIFRFPIRQLLLQMFLHSSNHRGELAVLLTSLGKPPQIDDIIVRFAEESGQPWPWKDAGKL